MEFDWVLFLGISIIGSYFGGKMCAVLEKKVTGEVRFESEFRTKRVITTFISIVLSYMATIEIINRINEHVSQDIDLLLKILSLIIGVNIYLLIQRVIYRISIGSFKRNM